MICVATKILSAMNDVARLAQLTADANEAKAVRAADLTIKKELLNIATLINAAANKGLKVLDYNLSGAVKKVDGFKALIEAEFADQGYTFEERENSSGAFSGYTITWEVTEEDPNQGSDEGNENQDPVDPNTNTDPEDPNSNTDPVDPNSGDDQNGSEDTPVYTYTAVTEEQLIENAENSPVELGWYEADAENEGNYVLTTDTTIDESKTYYIRTEVTE